MNVLCESGLESRSTTAKATVEVCSSEASDTTTSLLHVLALTTPSSAAAHVLVVDHTAAAMEDSSASDSSGDCEHGEQKEQTAVMIAGDSAAGNTATAAPDTSVSLSHMTCISNARLRRYMWRAVLAVICLLTALAVLVAQTLLGASVVNTERMIGNVKAQVYSILVNGNNNNNNDRGNNSKTHI